MQYLLVHDSVHGRFPGEVSVGDNKLIVDGKSIAVFTSKEASEIPWKR